MSKVTEQVYPKKKFGSSKKYQNMVKMTNHRLFLENGSNDFYQNVPDYRTNQFWLCQIFLSRYSSIKSKFVPKTAIVVSKDHYIYLKNIGFNICNKFTFAHVSSYFAYCSFCLKFLNFLRFMMRLYDCWLLWKVLVFLRVPGVNTKIWVPTGVWGPPIEIRSPQTFRSPQILRRCRSPQHLGPPRKLRIPERPLNKKLP